MSHFAELDSNNVVVRVVVGDNNDPAGDEGKSWLEQNLGGTWVQTSYNANFRKNYAGIGFTYDPQLDAFIPPKRFPSWVLDTQTCRWKAPIPRPEGMYVWNEETLSWVEAEEV
jgi:hypothetical protein